MQVITNLDSLARSNLEFPLSWHDLGISSTDLNSSKETGLVVSVHYGSSEADVSTGGAVVRSLLRWESRRWPSEWLGHELVLSLQKRVLLLDSVPWLFSFESVEDLFGVRSEVSVGWH